MSAVASPGRVALPAHSRTLGSRSTPGARIGVIRRSLPIVLPGSVLLVIVFSVILAPWIAPYDPNAIDMQASLSGPTTDHWLGTDQLGRDQLSRILYGGRSTLLVAAIGVFGVVSIGLVIGAVAGFFGGYLDLAVSSVLTILLALPTLLLTLAILGVIGPGTTGLLIAIIGAGWVGHARIFRAQVLSLRQYAFVEAAWSIGASPTQILRRHLWPNLLTNVIVFATLDVGALILIVSSLSFLGLGVQPPTADWGTMLNEARPFVGQLPLLAIAPGLCIGIVSLASNLLGDAIRDSIDSAGKR